MPKILTHLRLPLLALLTSVALTSCFNRAKKSDDPKPTICFPTTTPTTGGGGAK